MGKHNLQFGAYFVAAQKNELSSGQNNGLLSFDSTAPNSTGNAFADLLMGNIANFTQASAQPKYYNRYKIFEPYLQDDWHVSNKLTLNLGLRVSLFGTYREKEHQAYNFEPAAWDPANAPQIDVRRLDHQSSRCSHPWHPDSRPTASFNAASPARLQDVRPDISSIRPRASDLPTTHLAMAKCQFAQLTECSSSTPTATKETRNPSKARRR